MKRGYWLLPSSLLGLGLFWATSQPSFAGAGAETIPLVTGKFLTPLGSHAPVGSFPANLILSPDGKFAISTNAGFRQQLSVIDVASGKVVSKVDANGAGDDKKKEALYFGLAAQRLGGKTLVYASKGVRDRVGIYELSATGSLTFVRDLVCPAAPGGTPNFPAGLAPTSDGSRLVVALNETHKNSEYKGRLGIFDVANGTMSRMDGVPGYPLGVSVVTRGEGMDRIAYVASERDGVVVEIDFMARKVLRSFRTGATPAYLTLDSRQRRVLVSNSGSDTITSIDRATGQMKSLVVRPAAMRGLPTATPLGLGFSPDEKRLYVALADMNALAVVDAEKMTLLGYIPTGWYPTSVVATNDAILVANAKGDQRRNPNGKPVGTLGQYAPNLLEGTVARIPRGQLEANLGSLTKTTLSNNLVENGKIQSFPFHRPSEIEHVIYVVKENRTYDQVLGDLKQGNGDPSLTLFPRDVTPNQHALAERFALLDNFYVCAEVSADGWNWSTSGQANEYVQRNTVTNYSGRGRSYDFEGSNSGVAVDLQGLPNVARAPGGYLWDLAAKHGVSFRNYGMYIGFDDPEDKRMGDSTRTNSSLNKVLATSTDADFRRYDLSYADSDAWKVHGLDKAPRQLAEFGKDRAPSRMSAWLREYDEYLVKGQMPKLMLLRLGNDHTAGTSPGGYSPRAMLADNDYAVGQLVERVSRGPLWGKTAICILEDDAQAGYDHVDCHRSIAFVISPWTKRSVVDSRFYNTDSMLRTMEMLLGLPPMNGNDAVAPPIDVFGKRAENLEPFRAILPAKAIVGEINKPTAYRAKDSQLLINRFEEESLPDIELNDILWGSIRGAKTPRPPVIGRVSRD